MIIRAVALVLLGLALLLVVLPAGYIDRLSAVTPRHPRPAARPAASALEPVLLREDRRVQEDMNECLSGVLELRREGHWSRTTGFGYELAHRVLLDDGMFFSYVTNYQIFCGGPYIASGSAGMSLSVRDKARYEVVRLYRLAEGAEGHGQGLTLRNEIQLMVRDLLLAESGDSTDVDGGCARVLNNGGPDDYFAPKLLLAENGVMVIIEAPKAVSACYPPVVLTYDLVRRYLDRAEAARVGWQR